MVKRVKKILALAMMWALLGASISGAGADSYVYAAEEGKTLNAAKDQASSAIDTKNLYQTEKSFTVGTSLGADEFDGLKVTYDGKKAYSVKKGEQTVILSVTVLDETRAKTEIEQLTLKYGKDKNEKVIKGLKRISKPGLRIYADTENLPKVLGGMGIAIISTNKGVLTDKQARKENVGGEVLAFVW